jgi:hypothetical protein
MNIEFQMKALFIKTTLIKNAANIFMPRNDYFFVERHSIRLTRSITEWQTAAEEFQHQQLTTKMICSTFMN